MRRTSIKRRRSRLRPAKDRELYDAYIDNNPWSEWCYWTGWTINAKGKPEQWKIGTRIQASCRHHLWSFGQRPDALSLLISQTDHEHDWSHRHLTAARVISVLCKLKKREFDLAEAFRWTGKHIDGWLGTLSFDGELAFVEPLRIDAFIMAEELREMSE